MTISDQAITAVLFDLSGTLIDHSYIRTSLEALASRARRRWDIAPADFMTEFRSTLDATFAEYATRSYYRMRDQICETLRRTLGQLGIAATDPDVNEFEALLWATGIPAATCPAGTFETLAGLRHAGVRTGIVSYADTDVFEALLRQTGLDSAVDITICSQQARSCKPDAKIFLAALALVGSSPTTTIFVGDSIEHDIVGANRVGMRTALVPAGELSGKGSMTHGPLTVPDHHLAALCDVPDLVQPHRSRLTT
jgi:ribulose-1,5-bisphosphate 5-phosphatase